MCCVRVRGGCSGGERPAKNRIHRTGLKESIALGMFTLLQCALHCIHLLLPCTFKLKSSKL